MARELSQHFSGVGPTFTFLYGTLGLETGEFRFICAGHPGPVHLPRGAPPVHLQVTGLPVGVGTGSYPEHALDLRPGDRLLLYSDGVTEAKNAEGEHFGHRRVLATLERTRRSPLGDSLDTLVEDVERWRDGTPHHHDLSILFVERTDRAGPQGVTAAGRT
jgi:sigma-B regulation protein RsbU (phosphoserine phosphatase)